jgi:hypothetical protein
MIFIGEGSFSDRRPSPANANLTMQKGEIGSRPEPTNLRKGLALSSNFLQVNTDHCLPALINGVSDLPRTLQGSIEASQFSLRYFRAPAGITRPEAPCGAQPFRFETLRQAGAAIPLNFEAVCLSKSCQPVFGTSMSLRPTQGSKAALPRNCMAYESCWVQFGALFAGSTLLEAIKKLTFPDKKMWRCRVTETTRPCQHAEVRLKFLSCRISHDEAWNPIRFSRDLVGQKIQGSSDTIGPSREPACREWSYHPVGPLIPVRWGPGRKAEYLQAWTQIGPKFRFSTTGASRICCNRRRCWSGR